MSIIRHGGRSKSFWGCGNIMYGHKQVRWKVKNVFWGGAVVMEGHLLKIVLLMTGPKIGGAEGTSGSTGRLNISLVIQA